LQCYRQIETLPRHQRVVVADWLWSSGVLHGISPAAALWILPNTYSPSASAFDSSTRRRFTGYKALPVCALLIYKQSLKSSKPGKKSWQEQRAKELKAELIRAKNRQTH